ncbi:MAG: phospholipase D-like domain-containing protein, partial [Terriglobales bacterium]
MEIVIFRFDRPELERAMVDAVERGVFVHALIAFTNRGGEKHLRDLESAFLSKGITVARTAGDLVRYHGKMMIVDRKELYVLAFNFTFLDIDHSRSFGVVTRNMKQIQEAVRLFEADSKRQPYSSGNAKFIVSPANARSQLTAFLRGAKKELLIYDPKISDPQMLKVLLERMKAKVKIKVIGEVAGKTIDARRLSGMRLHTRCIVRDRCEAFVGSQSLRKLELDSRREIGIIVRDPAVVATLSKTFSGDWKASEKLAARPV